LRHRSARENDVRLHPDATGQVLVHRNAKSNPEAFLETVAPYRDDLVVAAECMFTWDWLADLCAAEGITFVLGHALAMKALHGAKAKNDKIDSHKIAVLLRGGLLPQAYVYPAAMRSTRDLLRRRLHLVRTIVAPALVGCKPCWTAWLALQYRP
jgi:transposase